MAWVILLVVLSASACSPSRPTPVATPAPTGPPTPAPPPAALRPGETTVSISIGGATRTYLLHVPPSYTGSTPVPLVIDLHGYTSTAGSQAGISGFRRKSDERGFLAAWPQGSSNSWNAYGCCGEAQRTNVDDVGFVRAVVADIRARGPVDPARIYVTGLSNGGAMTHRLACEAADLFAAAAPVSFPLNRASCPPGFPSRPITVVHFHGLADTTVPYRGNPFQAAPASFGAWQTIDGCSATPAVETFFNGDHCDTAIACAGGAQPALCSLSGGHVLYGTQATLNIADYAWDVFSRTTR